VKELIEEMMPRCIRRGTPLTQLQLEEPVGQWRHVEAVLRARQQMGGDVCDMWVAIALASEMWHPERCQRLCEEASKVSNDVPALLVSGGHKLEEANPLPEGVANPLPEDFRCCSSVLMRLPVLCKFLAASSSDMLGHKLCDLAFCSYAWNDPKAILCDLNLPWSVELCDPRSIDMAERIVSWVWERLVEDDVSMEEKQTAFALRRSAGSWALNLISAADFVRFFRGCQLTAQGLAMMQLYGDATWCTSTELQVWKRLSEAFQLGDDGFGWLQRQASDFCQQAKLSLGELQEPEEKLQFLLRSSKPSHRA